MMNRVTVILATIIFCAFVIMAKYTPFLRPVTNPPLVTTKNKLVLKKKTEIKKEVKIEKVKIRKPQVKKQKPAKIKTKKKEQEINIIVTFYTNSYEDCQSTAGISASGKNLVSASRGGGITYVAAPKHIPFNTKINVKGFGICDVQDRGGAINRVWIDNIEYIKLDVFVKGATRQQLLNKGLVKTTGHIIK